MSRPGMNMLNSALDGFEDDVRSGSTDVRSATERAVAASAAARGGAGMPGTLAPGDDTMQDALSKVIADIKDPDFQRTLEQTLHEMSSGAGNSTAGGAEHADADSQGNIAAGIFQSLAVESGAEGAESVAKTLEILQKLSLDADTMTNLAGGGSLAGTLPGATTSGSAAAMESMSDDVIKKMMEEFEALGQKEDFAVVVDNMMRQLLNKDIMAKPMAAICTKFPEWLAKNAEKLTKEEYENYGKMYQTFQKLVGVYETEPDNFPRLLELMQDLQDCGHPPQDIIAELAPGLEVSPDGLPMMPNMGPGMPSVPGMQGLPGGACSIM